MKLLSRLVGLCALSLSTVVTAAPVINSVITSYSATGVPNSISIFGTGLCAATNCSTKPAVTLGGVTLSPVSGSVTGIVAPLGLIADGDYVLKLTTTGTTSTTYNLTVKSKSTSGTGTTIAVGTTVTGASGTSASVTNTGTATAAVLNFTIPQGSVGSQGPVGNAGPQGLQGAPGSTGSQGPMGLQGLKGDKGDKGDTGAAGTDGALGLQGPKGDVGTSGIRLSISDSGDQNKFPFAYSYLPDIFVAIYTGNDGTLIPILFGVTGATGLYIKDVIAVFFPYTAGGCKGQPYRRQVSPYGTLVQPAPPPDPLPVAVPGWPGSNKLVVKYDGSYKVISSSGDGIRFPGFPDSGYYIWAGGSCTYVEFQQAPQFFYPLTVSEERTTLAGEAFKFSMSP